MDEGHKNVVDPKAPSFIAVDKNTGAVKWTNNDPGSNIMHGQWSNPVYAEPNGKPMVIFPGGDGWIRAFNPPDGALIWKFDCNPKNSDYTLGPEGTRSDFVATPVIYENKLYIGVGQDPEHGRRRPSVVHRHHQGAEEQGQGPVAGQRQFRPEGAGQQGFRPRLALRRRRPGRITTATSTSAAP